MTGLPVQIVHMIGKTLPYHDIIQGNIAQITLNICTHLPVHIQDIRYRQLLAVKMPAELDKGIVFRNVCRIVRGDHMLMFPPDPKIHPVATRLPKGLYVCRRLSLPVLIDLRNVL